MTDRTMSIRPTGQRRSGQRRSGRRSTSRRTTHRRLTPASLTRNHVTALMVTLWTMAIVLPVSVINVGNVVRIVIIVAFAAAAWSSRTYAEAPFGLTAAVVAVCLAALASKHYPALQVAGDGAVVLAAFEISVILLGWPSRITRLTPAGAEHLRAAARRIAVGIVAAVIVMLLGYVSLPAVTLMVVIGAIATAVVMQISTRR